MPRQIDNVLFIVFVRDKMDPVWIACVTLLLASAGAQNNKDEGDFCMLENGNAGICRIIKECPAAIEMIGGEKLPEICSFVDDSVIVCCPEGANNQVKPVTRPHDHRPHEHRPPSWGTEQSSTGSQGRPSTLMLGKPHVSAAENNVFKPPETQNEKPRMSEIKCKEYSASVTQQVEALPLLPTADPVRVTVAKCDISKLPLIVGGEKTMLGEFPHMAALGFGSDRNIEWNCGGSLISDYYVLTAAHCTASSKGPPVVVRLGELNLRSTDDNAHPQDFRVLNIMRHPLYKPPSKYNDIALLRLKRQVTFNTWIRPACLYNQDTFPVNKTVATGWGRIDFAESPSDVLLKVALDIIDNNLCNQLYTAETGQSTLPRGIISDMMCAGVLAGGMDTCQGDSGGPIQITKVQNKCVYYVIGVTSFGKSCAAARAPGVYTRVSHYVSWIESIVWP